MSDEPAPTRIIGMVWYRESDFPRVLQLFGDADITTHNYERWLKDAQRIFDSFKREGYIVEKAYLDPDTFPAWCAERGIKADSRARDRFADEFLTGIYGKPQRNR